jgi:mono/diheme cytochrome c family protein
MKTRKQKISSGMVLASFLLVLLGFPIKAVGAEEQKPDLEKGARLWKQNCIRCHNLRRPPERSDRQWEIIMAHMRLRGYLTGDEASTILEFMKATN